MRRLEAADCAVGIAITPFMAYAILREAYVVAVAKPVRFTMRLSSAGKLAPTLWLWKAARLGKMVSGDGFQDQTLLWLRRVASVGIRALPTGSGLPGMSGGYEEGLHQAALVAALDLSRSGSIQRTNDLLEPRPVYTKRYMLE